LEKNKQRKRFKWPNKRETKTLKKKNVEVKRKKNGQKKPLKMKKY